MSPSFMADEKTAHPEYAEMLPSKVDGLITTALETYAETSPEAHTRPWSNMISAS
jgi:FHS family L-fucose permease-like MFS transporter